MLSTLADISVIVLPVFGMVGVGFVAAKVGLISDKASDGLAEFVFGLAVPVLIFRTLSEAKLPDAQPWGYWVFLVHVAIAMELVLFLPFTKFAHAMYRPVALFFYGLAKQA